jgi:primosomal protein N' (replication factor Y)
VPGLRVRVPFGNRQVTGILMSTASESTVSNVKLKSVAEVLDTDPLFSEPLLALLTWASGYYHHPVGEVLPLGLSPGERRGLAERATGVAALTLTERGRGLPEGAPHRAPKQAALISLLRQGVTPLSVLAESGFSRAIIRTLIDHALVEQAEVTATVAWRIRSVPLAPNDEQYAAIQRIVEDADQFAVHLLYGVTGSGKTEVYLQTIAACLEREQQALVLLPEIALTPQTLARFEARFDAPVLALHSGMGGAERDRVWAAARRGTAAIILGTRSAVFVPLKKPGLIVVDEEHDAAFVQQDGFRYSARDVAIKRGQLEHCPVVLGSATPSLESWHNADQSRYQRHHLTQRAGQGSLPLLRQIDISSLDLSAGLSNELIEKIDSTLSRGHQVLVFLNRRGFATAMVCHDCGWVSDCPDCDARMTLHKTPAGLHCHHCDRRSALPRHCPQCDGRRLAGTGIGTQQTEAFLSERFSAYPVIRVDSDTMQDRESMANLIERLSNAEPALMIGTQMLSKGHHFPHVTLVAVVDADALLFSPDFRGEERLLQLLTQVSGRAGREALPGEVLIQTRHPEHPLMQQLDQPYDIALPSLLAQRQRAGLPPYGALAVIRCDSQDRQEGLDFLQQVKLGTCDAARCQIIGPLPAALARRKNRYRCQLVVAAAGRAALATNIAQLIAVAESMRHSHRLSWSVDIDPYESL